MIGLEQGGQISPLFHEDGQISPLFHEDGQDGQQLIWLSCSGWLSDCPANAGIDTGRFIGFWLGMA
jgi:hypothetical protein